MIVLPSERRGRGYDSIESCDRLPLSQTLLAVVLFLPLSPPIDQRQGAIRTEIESRDSGNGRLPGALLRFASDSPLEGDGFELPVPGRETVKPLWETGLLSGKTEADLLGNRRFESSSLQRGVRRELDPTASATCLLRATRPHRR